MSKSTSNGKLAQATISKQDIADKLNYASASDVDYLLLDLAKVLKDKDPESAQHPALVNPELVDEIPFAFFDQLVQLKKGASAFLDGSGKPDLNKIKEATGETDPATLDHFISMVHSIIELSSLDGKVSAKKSYQLQQISIDLDDWVHQSRELGFLTEYLNLQRDGITNRIQQNISQIEQFKGVFDPDTLSRLAGLQDISHVNSESEAALADLKSAVERLGNLR